MTRSGICKWKCWLCYSWVLCLHQSIVESHLAVLGRGFAGKWNKPTANVRSRPWEGTLERRVRRAVHGPLSSGRKKAVSRHQTSPSPKSQAFVKATFDTNAPESVMAKDPHANTNCPKSRGVSHRSATLAWEHSLSLDSPVGH
jgi:hypothetical protein